MELRSSLEVRDPRRIRHQVAAYLLAAARALPLEAVELPPAADRQRTVHQFPLTTPAVEGILPPAAKWDPGGNPGGAARQGATQ